jgi:hypothetical protein
MKNRHSPGKSAIQVINLEAGMPTVQEALSRLEYELTSARRKKSKILKLIHGYGSSGTGGDIRVAVQRKLVEMTESGQISDCIFGEDWSKSNEKTWKLLQSRPELKMDHDLERKNLGITIVML